MAFTGSKNSDIKWTWDENKKFENGLVEFPEGTPNRWEKIAEALGTKTAAEVEENYVILMEDIEAIQAEEIELPPYPDMDVNHNPILTKDQPPPPEESQKTMDWRRT